MPNRIVWRPSGANKSNAVYLLNGPSYNCISCLCMNIFHGDDSPETIRQLTQHNRHQVLGLDTRDSLETP
ncbi:hypothetical protein N7467_012069 [Penicillium canescens]|nr:hypothetical protein N7467_012069 [Penicillium canescens]